MDILSTGEKIKRARIYKGYTLKDLCEGKVSVSKMSCIENNKVNLEPEILEFVALKLDVDIKYLKQDIKDQIINNINMCTGDPKNLNYEEEMLYNLETSEFYGYFNYAFNIVHSLFSYYLKSKSNDKLQNILAKYYELYLKTSSAENHLIYNMDMGKFLFISKEYLQALNYYKTARSKTLTLNINPTYIIEVILDQARCNIELKNYKNAYDVAILLLDYLGNIEDKHKLSEVYHLVAILSLRIDLNDFANLENKSIKANKEDYFMKAENKFDYTVIFFHKGNKKKALKFLKESVEIFPKEDKLKLTGFLLKNVNLLIENDEIDMADCFCEDSLNFAIDLKNDKLIEKAYYYKSLILCIQNNFVSAEMYINLSLDVLTKFGKKNEIYTRYMEIGNMYNKIGAVSDALKYFTLAIVLKQKL